MVTVNKSGSDLRLSTGGDTVDLRVSSVTFNSTSGNVMVHHPRVGAPQVVEGHVTEVVVDVFCDVTREGFDRLVLMAGRSVVLRLASGGGCEGVLSSVQAIGEPASWETEEPYVAANFSVLAAKQTVGVG